MEKKWYIKIDGNKEGPYSYKQIKHHKKVNPDTLVWDNQQSKWVKIYTVVDFKDLFKDEESVGTDEETEDPNVSSEEKLSDELVLELQSGIPPIFYWMIFLLILLIVYALYR